ncbi:MAG TPA: hypothetical protein VNV60_09675 [Holophagaceae bacterium]|jgi:hypothetical protein|nr:hypothetical protein [Holophagaceae bacterium]
MTPREAEQLLGGYATGTLSDEERKVLFAAALEDQTLFDALADEEALRDLLADAGTRMRLLALLEEPARKPAVPFWRRPASLGLAASILAAVGVGLVLRHGPAPEASDVHAPALSEEQPKAAAPPQNAVETPQSPVIEKKRSFARSSPRLDQAPAVTPPPAPIVSEAKRAPEPPSAEAGASVAGAFAFAPKMALDARKEAAMPPPVWSLEAAPAGTFRLKVRWGPEGHLYLLRRDASGVSVIASNTSALQDGKTESVFTGTLEAGGALDLYLLHEASKAPDSLPAESPIQGFRHRVWPEEK